MTLNNKTIELKQGFINKVNSFVKNIFTSNNNRTKWIDIARGIAMIIIVISHCLVHSVHCKYVYRYICSFIIPLFFMLSGMTFRVKEDVSFFKFTKNKFIRIMIPYFVWEVVFLIPYLIFRRKSWGKHRNGIFV